ncbi:MAG: CDP-alcohol phosphatidyltransferase family protein [Eubacterium sp.]|nr:CDP-alcohol phosphatidyltransferase family protein [Eubacterium sp.]
MIGVFDYTVILTYISAVSGVLGIIVSLYGSGHPYMGAFFLLVCGLCDAFDGKVARKKKNRTDFEKSFGIQIDSLADLISFGVLPGCMGFGLLRASDKYVDLPNFHPTDSDRAVLYPVLFVVIIMIYVLAALIRLAYFNVTEEERARSEGGVRKTYVGLPVTSSALIFPTVLLIRFITNADFTPIYFAVMVITAFLFVSRIRIAKAGTRGIIIMICIGVIEFGVMLYFILTRGAIPIQP